MTTQDRDRKKQFITLLWLFGTLWVFLGSHKVLAQGSVGVTVTISGTSTAATAPIGGTATFSASASAIPTPDTEWSVNGDPTYSWSATPAASSGPSASFDPSDKAETTGSATYSSAGTYSIAVTCTVTYPVVKSDPGQADDGDTATISGTNKPAATATVYFIGGPITGTNDIHYYCDPAESADWGHLSAAGGQPAGTTYSWSISGPAQLVQDSAYPSPADATYSGLHPGSTTVGDVTANLTYLLNGVSAKSPSFPITVHAPTTFVVLKDAQTTGPTKITSGDNAYGFDGQHLHFQVLDGLKQPIPGGTTWDESWSLQGNGQGPAPPEIGDTLDGTGSSIDRFYKYGNAAPTGTNPNGNLVLGPFTHKYSVTDESQGTSGGDVGCPVQTYTNVDYYTYGVVGNGF